MNNDNDNEQITDDDNQAKATYKDQAKIFKIPMAPIKVKVAGNIKLPRLSKRKLNKTYIKKR